MVAAALPRSFLYVPGNRPDLFEKAFAGDADAILLDLEDAVGAGDKKLARALVAEVIESRPIESRPVASRAPETWVRVDAVGLEADLNAVVARGLDGVFLAKCGDQALKTAGRLLEELERDRGIEAGTIGVVGLIEDAEALTELPQLCRDPRLLTVGIGEVDLLADLRMTRGPRTAAALDAIRTRVVVDCAASGCLAPVAPTSTDFRDRDAFVESSRLLLELGFRSRTAIHPSQVRVINDVFTPGETELKAARELMSRLEVSAGGVALDSQGRMIDAAVVRSAREIVQRAERD